ncbi:hypothetical protein B0T14DRAFT_189653 [Immersiella caudata]|uniref:Uncharacterized protein n=1 Tax=Immersiella caudata TaxID=314043 RepID=A0AA39WYD5_9PEZI|nr:hypothetical protein B0T14DRAFT_189653 [Immersiella caudata]
MHSTTSRGNNQSEFRPWTGCATPRPLEKLAVEVLDQPPDQTSRSPPERRSPQSSHNANHDGSPRLPDGHDPELFRPKTSRFWAILVCNFLCLFLIALDRTIFATAVSRITDEFGAFGRHWLVRLGLHACDGLRPTLYTAPSISFTT